MKTRPLLLDLHNGLRTHKRMQLQLVRTPPPSDPERPATRADCLVGGKNAERPCPYSSCRHHLALDTTATGNIRVAFPDTDGEPVDFDRMLDTCSLDVADRGEMTPQHIGARLNISKQRADQIAIGAFRRLLARGRLRQEWSEP